MAVTLNLWNNFSKRRNSTKQPSTTATYSKSVTLKGPVDIDNPTLVLDGAIDSTVCYAQFMGNYYYIDKVVSLNKDLWEISMSMDEMATYKTNVGSTVARILYSATGYDTKIVDSRVIAKVDKEVDDVNVTLPLFDSTGCYILAIANITGGPTGAATQYVLNSSHLNDILMYLSQTDIISELKNMVNSSMDTVLSCIWVPFNYTELITNSYTSITNIYFGEKDSGINSFKLNGNISALSSSMTIPWKYNDFRRQPPYTTMSMYLPFFGNIDVNAADLIGETNLGYMFSIDIPTGDITLLLTRASDGTVIQSINYNVAVNCPVVATSNNMSGTVSSVSGVVGGLAATAISFMTGSVGGTIASGLATILAGSNAAIQYNSRSTSIKGTTQGRSMSFANTYLSTKLVLSVFSQLTENPDDANYIATHGRPVCQTHSVSTHSGYVQTENASVSIAGLRGEADRINAIMNSGFYYE